MKKFTLDLVNKQHNGINEIRANIRYFNRESTGSSDNSSRARKLLTGTSYWLYDEATDAFGPSKFVGFNSMTLAETLGEQTRNSLTKSLFAIQIFQKSSWHGARTFLTQTFFKEHAKTNGDLLKYLRRGHISDFLPFVITVLLLGLGVVMLRRKR